MAVPLWYAAFPSTLTISLIRAFVATYSSGYCARCRGFIEVGLTDFVLSPPLNQVRKALEALVPQSISAAAASDSRSAAQVSSVPPQAPRRAPGTTRGLAGSKRTATVNPQRRSHSTDTESCEEHPESHADEAPRSRRVRPRHKQDGSLMRLTAIAVAPVVAAGLVIAPHTSDIAVPPIRAHDSAANPRR